MTEAVSVLILRRPGFARHKPLGDAGAALRKASAVPMQMIIRAPNQLIVPLS